MPRGPVVQEDKACLFTSTTASCGGIFEACVATRGLGVAAVPACDREIRALCPPPYGVSMREGLPRH
jgi:hypothetical protein